MVLGCCFSSTISSAFEYIKQTQRNIWGVFCCLIRIIIYLNLSLVISDQGKSTIIIPDIILLNLFTVVKLPHSYYSWYFGFVERERIIKVDFSKMWTLAAGAMYSRLSFHLWNQYPVCMQLHVPVSPLLSLLLVVGESREGWLKSLGPLHPSGRFEGSSCFRRSSASKVVAICGVNQKTEDLSFCLSFALCPCLSNQNLKIFRNKIGGPSAVA